MDEFSWFFERGKRWVKKLPIGDFRSELDREPAPENFSLSFKTLQIR